MSHPPKWYDFQLKLRDDILLVFLKPVSLRQKPMIVNELRLSSPSGSTTPTPEPRKHWWLATWASEIWHGFSCAKKKGLWLWLWPLMEHQHHPITRRTSSPGSATGSLSPEPLLPGQPNGLPSMAHLTSTGCSVISGLQTVTISGSRLKPPMFFCVSNCLKIRWPMLCFTPPSSAFSAHCRCVLLRANWAPSRTNLRVHQGEERHHGAHSARVARKGIIQVGSLNPSILARRNFYLNYIHLCYKSSLCIVSC